MLRYNIDNTIMTDFDFGHIPIVYADIVDRSHFVLDRESVRNAVLSTSAGGSGVPLYDDNNNLPSKDVVLLRSGKLDKGEVFQHQLQLQDDIKSAKTDFERSKAILSAKKSEESRQKYLDKLTGYVDTDTAINSESV